MLFAAKIYDKNNLFISILKEAPIDSLLEQLDKEDSASEKIDLVKHEVEQLFESKKIKVEPIIERIAPDGDCMFRAIIHGYRNLGMLSEDIEISSLRSQVTEFLSNERQEEIISQLLDRIINRDFRGLPDELAKSLLNLSILRDGGIEDRNISYLIREYNLIELYLNHVEQNGAWGDGFWNSAL